MTDCFALLGQTRRPWLDPDALKQAFHARSLQSHPDAQPGNTAPEFAQLNEAHQVLQDPKRRLHHLLTLEGFAPQPGAAPIPPEIEVLFSTVAALTQEVERLLAKTAAAMNPLSRSLLKAETLQVQNRLTEALAQLQRLHEEANARLQDLTAAWEPRDPAVVGELQRLYLLFSYVTRWRAELREKQLQLA
ncbi:hypothetical protein BH20VER1_BH20VER1_30120 [soil metagenome]